MVTALLIATALLFAAQTGAQKGGPIGPPGTRPNRECYCWTKWLDRDNPSAMARETMRECKTFGGNPDPLSVPNQFMFSAESRTLVLTIHMVQVRPLYQYSSLLDPRSMLFHIQVKNLSHILQLTSTPVTP